MLKSAGVESPRLDAELIIAGALACERLDLYAAPERAIGPGQWMECLAMAQRRSAREPLAYVLGSREFYGLNFEVAPGVLIPRPETEAIVELALIWHAEWAGRSNDEPPKSGGPDKTGRGGPLALDLGTGSGCIAVACAYEQKLQGLPGRWIATDVSGSALEIARRNARKHGVADRIEFRLGPYYEPIASPVDIICTNPPYVARESSPGLQPEVRDWEPEGALFSEESGLAHVRQILERAPEFLSPGGIVLMEIGMGQSEAVARLAARVSGIGDIEFHQDLAEIPRILQARRA